MSMDIHTVYSCTGAKKTHNFIREQNLIYKSGGRIHFCVKKYQFVNSSLRSVVGSININILQGAYGARV